MWPISSSLGVVEVPETAVLGKVIEEGSSLGVQSQRLLLPGEQLGGKSVLSVPPSHLVHKGRLLRRGSGAEVNGFAQFYSTL